MKIYKLASDYRTYDARKGDLVDRMAAVAVVATLSGAQDLAAEWACSDPKERLPLNWAGMWADKETKRIWVAQVFEDEYRIEEITL